MSDGRSYIPVYQFRLNSIIAYCLPDFVRPVREKSLANLTGRLSASGVVSKGIQSRISKIVSLLILSTPTKRIFNPVIKLEHDFKLGFLTLTMPKQELDLTAKEANKLLLEPVVLYLRRKCGVTSYIWKLEYQQNGSIHYHLTINSFIDYTKLRNEWNRILRKNGLLDCYYEKYKNWNPNSTDVHSVKNINNIESYLVKYLAKGDQSKTSNSKIWDCSKNLKAAKFYEIVPETKHYQMLEDLVVSGKVTKIVKDNFHIYKFKAAKPTDILTKLEKTEYANQMLAINS
jgi:hypothetical protein